MNLAIDERALHQRISLDLEANIRSGAWPPGFRIPFEHELTAQYGFARATVNKAVSALVAVGLIEGAPADIVALDLDHPSLAGRDGDALLDGWIFAARGGAVDRVWRRGRKVVEAGRHVDRAAIAQRYRATLAKVLTA